MRSSRRSAARTLAPHRVVGQVVYGANYERLPASAAEARYLVAGALAVWGLDRLGDDAALIVTELVSNAIAHAEGDGLRVTVTLLSRAEIRIGVIDRSTQRPEVREQSVDQERGRGMCLVAALSSTWGVDVLPGGKRVWSTLEATS